MPLEDIHQPGKVQQGSAQPIDLVDHYTIDPSGFHVRNQFLQGRTIEIAARVAAVIVTFGDHGPARMPLAQNIRFGSFSLCLQRVERLVQSIFSRFPCVDSTALWSWRSGMLGGMAIARHFLTATPGNRKKENPFQDRKSTRLNSSH